MRWLWLLFGRVEMTIRWYILNLDYEFDCEFDYEYYANYGYRISNLAFDCE